MVPALEKEFITIKQLLEAMNIQLEEATERMSQWRAGEILVGLGYINQNQMDEALVEMGVQG